MGPLLQPTGLLEARDGDTIVFIPQYPAQDLAHLGLGAFAE